MDNYKMKYEKKHFDFILFDMIGTTIQDTNHGKSIVLDSFKNAFLNYQINSTLRHSRKWLLHFTVFNY